MGNNWRRPANVAAPVDWQASAKRLQHELEQAQRERDEAIERADSYREAAMELYLWTKEPHDRSPNG